MSRINDKIEEIEKSLDMLNSFTPKDFDEYSKDEKTKAACEHFFEKIIEALADLAFLCIKDMRLVLPKDDVEAFVVLAKNGLISVTLAERLREAKGMRNIISHEYGKVDDELVFDAITNEIPRDAREFIDLINKKFGN